MYRNDKIGFMQGRLSDMQFGRIQSFPWGVWENELDTSHLLGIKLMEWTIDNYNFELNPILANPQMVKEILTLKNMKVDSITCDSFMESPFWQIGRDKSRKDLTKIVLAMDIIGARMIVIPLVDNSSLSRLRNFEESVEFFLSFHELLENLNIQIAFEVDTDSSTTRLFIDRFPLGNYGINYDIGNSASLGFNPVDEFSSYANRIINIHVKDRKIGGGTVPLGEGDADFDLVFNLLKSNSYEGNYILQTARDENGDHAEALSRYLEFTEKQISRSNSRRN